MIIKAYNVLVRILYPLIIAKYIKKRQGIGKEDIARKNERVGRPSKQRPEGKLIWLHGASVGESLSMLPLIKSLLDISPNINVMVTTGTVTSADLMAKRLPERAFHQYIPIDHPVFTTRFVKHWQPDLVLWFESDFWPSMLHAVKRKNIPLILVNGRISNRSFKRWQQFDFIIKELLGCFTCCLGQSDEDAHRLRVLGAQDAICLGNLKYAGLPLPVDENKKNETEQQIAGRPFWLMAATHDDEEVRGGKIQLKLKQQFPNMFTLIAPRHPNRGEEIAEKLSALGLKTALRSKNEPITAETDVYIANTIGEMGIWYTLSKITFIGGSLIPHGGQNFMEPSRMKNCVLTGPYMHNFTDAMNKAKKADAIIQTDGADTLYDNLVHLFENKDLLEAKRSLAYNWAISENKVLDGILEKVKGYL